MTDKKLRYYLDPIPDDLLEKYSELADYSKKQTGVLRRGSAAFNALISAGLSVVGILAAIICVTAINNKRPDKHTPGGTIIQPTAITTSTPAVETITPFTETPEPSERPTDEPVKTIDNTASPAPTLTPTPTGSPDITPVITETSETPTPRPGYMENYGEWMDWREANPEAYEEWLQLPLPEIDAAERRKQLTGNEWLEYCYDESGEYVDYNKPRFWIDMNEFLLEVIPKDKYDQAFISSCPNDPLSVPKTLTWLQHFNITKEELIEYVKWRGIYKSGRNYIFDITFEEIELLYSGDTRRIRDYFKIPEFTFCCDDLIFTRKELSRISDFDLGRMFPPESSDVLILSEQKRAELPRAREEYERIKKRDANELTLEAAAEMIDEFMVLYKEIRLSPDKHAGELIKNIPKYKIWEDRFGEYAVLTDPADLLAVFNKVQYSVFPFGFTDYYSLICENGQIKETPADWLDNLMLISPDPKYYRGEIEPFDNNYTLADHINIVYTDNEDAYVELTARKRDGSGEAVYTVNFKKSYERWRISSGTMLDLIFKSC